jgi:hypothetical protein
LKFIALLGGTAVEGPLAAHAQQAASERIAVVHAVVSKDSRINAGKWIFVSAPGHEADMPTCLRFVRFEGDCVARLERTDHVLLVMCS